MPPQDHGFMYQWSFRDPDGQVLYVGKSVTLRTRLASYFATDRERKVIAMTRRAATVDWHLTSSEVRSEEHTSELQSH